MQLEWDQAHRRLLTPLELRSWESPDILANSVVQIVVGADGTPASVTLLSRQRFQGGGPGGLGTSQRRAVRAPGSQSVGSSSQRGGAIELGPDDLPMAHSSAAAHQRPSGKSLRA